MANTGKFHDRAPYICAAGKPNVTNFTVRETLNNYPLLDQVNALKHEFNIPDKEPFPPYKFKKEYVSHRGTCDEIKEKWIPPLKTRYESLIGDLKETSYDSYWKKELGRAVDEVPGIPEGLQAKEFTFGIKSAKDEDVKSIIYPPLTRYEVLWNSQINHDNYKKIYNDYNPGEKKTRNYIEPYNPENCAGHKTTYDKRGTGTKCAMKWVNYEPFCLTSKTRVDFNDKFQVKLAKPLTPVGCINLVPEGHSFGKPTERPALGMEELLKDKPPALLKKEMLSTMAALNRLRQNIKKKFGPTFTLRDLFFRFVHYDQACTGRISMNQFYAVMNCIHINFHREKLETLFKTLRIIENNSIDYGKFIKALEFDLEFGAHLDPLPSKLMKNYMSQAESAYLDYLFIDNSKLEAAGHPTIRIDLPRPLIHANDTPKKDRGNLQTDTAQSLLKHSIFFEYGITYGDMFKQRSKECMKGLFEKANFNLSPELFEHIYQEALEVDDLHGTGEVSTETFYNIFKRYQNREIQVSKQLDDFNCNPKDDFSSCKCKDN